MDVRIVFDERDMTTTFTDTVETGEVRVVVTYPDEIVHDLGKNLKAATSWMVQVPSRTDLLGKIMQGTYTVLVERYDVGGTVPTDTETVTFELSYSSLPVTVTEEWDVFTPRFRLTDSTEYERSGYLTTAPLDRLWTASNGPHEWSLASSAFIDLYDGGYFNGTYDWSLEMSATSVMDNNYVEVISEEVASGTKTINTPVMLPELAALFNCLYSKILAKNCCEDATYDEMVADYQLAIAMSSNFILNGQAGITGTVQSSLLLGSDCNPGILGLLRKWGCEDQEVEDTVISTYDWCLCESSGDGDGDAVVREGYLAGTGAWITSDAVDDDLRYEYVAASGVGSFTQNQADTRIFGGTIRGNSATASHTSNGATNSFKLTLPIPGESANIGYASALLAGIAVWSAPDVNPTASAPWVKDEGSVQKRIVDISAGTVSFVFAGIGATYPSGWAITFETP